MSPNQIKNMNHLNNNNNICCYSNLNLPFLLLLLLLLFMIIVNLMAMNLFFTKYLTIKLKIKKKYVKQ